MLPMIEKIFVYCKLISFCAVHIFAKFALMKIHINMYILEIYTVLNLSAKSESLNTHQIVPLSKFANMYTLKNIV